MVKTSEAVGWREARRRSAREAIVDAAWMLVDEEGLAALTIRDLARRAGITTPTVYAYFDSKNAIYDAMFGQAAGQFADAMGAPFDITDPRELLVESVKRFVEFCTVDTARYQLLFQRTIPGFEPSPDSFEPAERALAQARNWLALNGITEERYLDLWTALLTGLVDQQVSNDPGGDRWTCLIEESITMFLAHCANPREPRKSSSRSARTKGGPS